MSFKKYIKAVGTGVKGNRDLNEDEVIDAIDQILSNKATPAQIGAFLIGLRVKLESEIELKASLKALRKYIKFYKIEDSLELGYSYDGRVKNPFLFPLYPHILKEFEKNNKDVRVLNLVMSTDYVQPAKNGLVIKDIKNEFNLGDKIHIFDRVDFLKPLSDLTPIRHELGLRTVFNTVEKLLGVGQSEYAVTTAFHKPYVQKYINMYKDFYKNVTIVKGTEGSPEVFSDGKYWRVENNQIVDYSYSIKDYGINYTKSYDGISKQEVIEMIKNPDDDIIKLAKFNIALYLVFANRVKNLDEAWERLN